MNISKYDKDIYENIEELCSMPLLREDRIPLSNLFITMLFLKTISLGYYILNDKESFEAAMRFHGNILDDDYTNPLSDAQILQDRAAKYYGKSELKTITLGVDTKAINEAMKYKPLNNLCDKLIQVRDNESYEVFLRYLEVVLFNIAKYRRGRFFRFTDFWNLDMDLIEIAAKVLDVKDEHTFADFTSGYGITTLFILGDRKPNIILRDNAEDVLALSQMLLIAAGKDIENVKLEDIFHVDGNEDLKADRIFMDPPFRTSPEGGCTSIDGIELKDAWVAAIMKSVKALKDDGMAIIAVPAIVLHGVQNGLKEVREYLLENHLLQAVAGLPRCWKNSNIPTHILVLSKRNNTKARFINCIPPSIERSIAGPYYHAFNAVPELLTKDIEPEYENFAKDVDYKDISAESFIAGVYVTQNDTQTKHDRKDIDDKLRSLYEEMGRAIEDLLK